MSIHETATEARRDRKIEKLNLIFFIILCIDKRTSSKYNGTVNPKAVPAMLGEGM
ncbi:hypothetical protein LL038_17525 [Clostridium estertheticum]|uniref:Uncharacterized protein n=1 Tax=Clostridium estertheticum TaxID=238834 RepID=A0AA47I6G7_9CLOT|nr:hypothetical protein [Clostridium estertheticum]MBU3157801.1 hypothetical protein [Clostridium estertheticum]WAG59424.1 hypothetical protein LL038_17525 [Clostridium estertheticum]